ncbi:MULTISPECIES: cupin-like domain-containing protein [Klebsiella pneumoniae complex]|uniref:cupin-like domain-containing protein n=1 Tax=Klebsiella pneumoniae complex TaxID=3390273 RepID=UPI0007A08469|nr:cupin-like domain-containing protein [Klebsiella quasipneumoniae]KYZ74130.1 hypothetical protein A2G95_20105 [Klebsiella quasipneumoniae subsp. similipneumoniae]
MAFKVERIKLPSNDVFEKEIMHPLRPVIITNLFEGDVIREINTREKVVEHFGNMMIGIQDEYGEAYKKQAGANSPGNKSGTLTMSVKDYLNYLETTPDTKMMCIEFPSPEMLSDTYHIPDVCRTRKGESEKFVNQCFIGNKGNFAHIHIDKAGTHGFLYQVFGRKRFITWPQSASHKLAPFAQIAGWSLEHFTDADRQAFLEFTGGCEVILEAGECMFVPALSWHYVDYIEDSMSISLRFRRSDYITRLANVTFPDFYYQGIGYKLASPQEAKQYEPLLQQLEAKWDEQYDDGFSKMKDIRQLTKMIYHKLYPEAPEKSYFLEYEDYLPPLLPEFLDANNTKRPKYA